MLLPRAQNDLFSREYLVYSAAVLKHDSVAYHTVGRFGRDDAVNEGLR